MSGLWHLALPDRSNSMEELDTAGISLLPFGKFPTMLVVSDSVGFTSDSPLTYDMTAAFPVAREGRPPQTMRFSEFYTRPGCTPVNASPERSPVQTHHSGPKLMANLYFVRLFHSLLSNDFADAPYSYSAKRYSVRRGGRYSYSMAV